MATGSNSVFAGNACVCIFAFLSMALMAAMCSEVLAFNTRCSAHVNREAGELRLYKKPGGKQIGVIDTSRSDLNFEAEFHDPTNGKEVNRLTEMILVTVVKDNLGNTLGYLRKEDGSAFCY